MRATWVGAIAAAAAAFVTRPVAAQQPSPCGSIRPRVDLSGSSADETALVPLLRAQLASRGLDLCPGDGADGAIATVSVNARADGATIDVDVRDRLTDKRVSRDVDLSSVPADGRSLTLAVVVDELLRASWAELALASSPPASQAVPPAVRRSIQDDLATPPRDPAIRLEALAEVEAWTGALTLYGADLRVAFVTPPGLGATVRIGGRGAPTATAGDGQVQATALLGGVAATFRAVPAGSRLGLDAVARMDAVRIAYVAVARPGASGVALADTTIVAGAGVDGWLALGPSAQLVAEVLVDAPLRAVVAQDGGHAVVAASGIGVEGGAGVRVGF